MDTKARNTVQQITNPIGLAIWTYLFSKPADIACKREDIIEHFDGLGRSRYDDAMRDLKEKGFVLVDVVRDRRGRLVSRVLRATATPGGAPV